MVELAEAATCVLGAVSATALSVGAKKARLGTRMPMASGHAGRVAGRATRR